MDEKLYEKMDWAAIEAVVYSEEDHPHDILGPHITEDGVLIQTYIPTAVKVTVKLTATGKDYPMEQADDGGLFAVLVPRKSIPEYVYEVQYDDGSIQERKDPYAFEPQITEKDTKQFNAGINYEIYEKLGAHPMTVKGTKGVYFAVWAPNAMRVSVVGDFNLWDGRTYQMRRLWDSGIFEIFVPDLEPGELYKFEIKAKSGLVFLKADPYANAAELRPATASIVSDISAFSWSDSKWMSKRKQLNYDKAPMSVYEVHLGSWRRPDEEGKEFYNYRELAPMMAEYVKEMGYTHIELMPVMEYPFDASWGYQVTGYYAPTSRHGNPEDFMYFVNYMHENGIGILLDWVPAHFPRDTFGLSNFDGTCLYEHLDPRQGSHPHWGTLIYNYGRPEVRNFLIANVMFWLDKYHADGIRMDAVASMLYLDYGKEDGQWLPNIYGGKENLEAVEFLKELNTAVKKRKDGSVVIAEESTSWPEVTGDAKKDGLGFDFKWNMGWMNDFIEYMKYDPIERSYHHGELTFSMIYAYSEKFILSLSHDEVVHLKGSLIQKMPGEMEKKFANLRAAYGFMMAHPGKKLLFMGQEFGQLSEWSEEKSLEWELLDQKEHLQMHDYVKELNKLYKNYPALYELDYDEKGFEWINNISADENMLVFVRKSRKAEDTLVVVCNFSDVVYENHKIGVPYAGKYKEIFNSDKEEFGGTGEVNPRVKVSKKEECDDRPNSIKVKVPPLGVSIFKYSKELKKVMDNKTAKESGNVKTVKVESDAKAGAGSRSGNKKNLKDELMKQMEKAEAKAKPALKAAEKVVEETFEDIKKLKDNESSKKNGNLNATKDNKILKNIKESKTIKELKTVGEKIEKSPTVKTAKKTVNKTTESAIKAGRNTMQKAKAAAAKVVADTPENLEKAENKTEKAVSAVKKTLKDAVEVVDKKIGSLANDKPGEKKENMKSNVSDSQSSTEEKSTKSEASANTKTVNKGKNTTPKATKSRRKK